MALQTSVQTKAAALNGQLSLLDGGTLEIYSGTQPVATSTTVTDQTLLSVHNFAAEAFGTTVTATATSNPISQSVAVETGTASFYRAKDSSGVVHRQGGAGVSGSGAELIMDSVDLEVDGTVRVVSYSVAQG